MIMLLKPRTGRQSPMRELGHVRDLFRPWRDFHSVSCLVPSDESLGNFLSPKGLFNPTIINGVECRVPPVCLRLLRIELSYHDMRQRGPKRLKEIRAFARALFGPLISQDCVAATK
jgi:hypothetical protein